jgi:hypothetical protein
MAFKKMTYAVFSKDNVIFKDKIASLCIRK